MATINEILKTIDDSVNGFNESIPKVQQQLFDEINELSSKLETRNGRILANAKNIRLIGQIKQRFDKLITKNKGYKERVKKFTEAFGKVEQLQDQYFSETIQKYSRPQTLAAIRTESIDATIESLTGNGMKQSLVEPIREILRTNITSGAKYTDLTKSLRDFMLDNKTGEGRLAKHVKQITTDALNQYARTNIQTVTDNLGLEYFSYNGAIIDTSRPFCVALHKKKYFHKSEIPDLIKGDFKEFKDIDGKIDSKTGLPYGMIKDTNANNFLTLAGGWNCNHSPIPVDVLAVPESKRVK